jgi:hypothetical protein
MFLLREFHTGMMRQQAAGKNYLYMPVIIELYGLYWLFIGRSSHLNGGHQPYKSINE